MRVVTFPYYNYRGLKHPIIPLDLCIGGEWKNFRAYVDSGATYTIFAASEVSEFWPGWRDGRQMNITVGDGSLIPIYIHKLKAKLGQHELIVPIAFSPRLGVGFNLLGRAGIFSHFDVTFSDSRGEITFTPV